MLNKTLSAACLLAALTFAATAGADEYHYNNILIGDRASGMGGAYTAVSDDPSGMYYNPAGIAYSAGKSFSASVNAYNVSDRTYKGVFGGANWTRRSSYLLPNFFGILQPIGKLKVGFSYAVPDSNQEDQDQNFRGTLGGLPGTQVINFNNKNDTNLFGPSAAVQLSDTFAIGGTLYVHKRNTEAILNGNFQTDDLSQFFWTNSYLETDEWGIRPVLGLMWAPVEKVSVGLSLTKTFIWDSTTLAQSTQAQSAAPPFVTTNNTQATFGDKREYPYQVNLGVAYFPTTALLLTGDVSFFSAYEYGFLNNATTIKRDAVVNGSLGAEYYFTKEWALRAGLFTDFANTPKLTEGGSSQAEHIDLFGGSLSLTHFSRNSSISAGGSYKYGSGKSQILGGTSALQDATAQSWTMFVSSSYSY